MLLGDVAAKKERQQQQLGQVTDENIVVSRVGFSLDMVKRR